MTFPFSVPHCKLEVKSLTFAPPLIIENPTAVRIHMLKPSQIPWGGGEGGGAMVTNDWCITVRHQLTIPKTISTTEPHHDS